MVIDTWTTPINPGKLMKKGVVHLWKVYLPSLQHDLSRVKYFLSEEEIQKGQQLQKTELRQRYWSVHVCKRHIIGQYLKDQSPKQLIFIKNDYGKPYLKLHTQYNLQFNISYSTNMMLIALSQGHEIGVDVEKIDININFLELAKNFFSMTEYKQLINVPSIEQASAFYRLWTLKEAVIKTLGKGLSYPLSSFDVKLAPDFKHCLCKLSEPLSEQWEVFSFKVDDNYLGAIASCVKLTHCYFWDLSIPCWDLL